MAAKTDLWGEIVTAPVRTPVVIMREQAALLGTKTSNLLEATVKTDAYGDQLVHRFQLVVPALSSYTYELFKVRHGAGIYPVTVISEQLQPPNLRMLPPGGRDGVRELLTEQQFTDWLGAQLSSEQTKTIVANLLAQVTK